MIARLAPLALLSLSLLGCPPKEDDSTPEGDTDTDADTDSDTDGDADADADTDADADSDADADADADSDADADESTFEGTLSYFTDYDGAPVCDATLALLGTEYTGTCDGCDFAFAIDATVTEDDGTAECYLHPLLSYIDDAYFANMMMAHMDSMAGYYGSYSNVFATGFSYDLSAYGYGYYPGPYFWVLAADGLGYGTFSRDGDDISWTWDYTGYETDYTYYYFDTCSSYLYYDDFAELVPSAFTGTSDMDCAGQIVDVWTVELLAGQTAEVSVDTVDSGSAFDPLMWFNDTAGCTVAYNDDSFDCTYPPPSYQCPSVDYEITADGTYQIVVASYGSCAGSTAEYQVAVDVGGADPNLQLLADDATRYGASSTPFGYAIAGSGTITPAE